MNEEENKPADEEVVDQAPVEAGEEAAPEAAEDEKIEATHDNEKVEEKVAPALSGEKEKAKKLPKLNEEVFMVGDEMEVEGCKFAIAEVGGLKLVLKRMDIK